MTVTIKQGDTHDTVWTVGDADAAPVNLTGATVRLLARRQGTTTTITLASTITDAIAGKVTHSLTGTLIAGVYDVELEVTSGGDIVTAPNDGYETLVVVADLRT